MGDLKQWARDNNPNLRFEEGETVTGIYKGYQIVPDPFNPGQEKVQYTIEVDGKMKFWTNKSGSIAMKFDNAKVGEEVSIMATGEGMKRRYVVEFAAVKGK